jgi:FMN reductase
MNTPLNISDHNITILGIGGSTRGTSRNGTALQFVLERARLLRANTEIIDLHAYSFPMLNRDLALDDYPVAVSKFIEAVACADGFVLESPTYHGSMSGAFKNALDLLIYGDDTYFRHKPVGVMAIGGANGTPVLDMVTTTVHSLKGFVVPGRVLVPHGAVQDDGSIANPDVVARLHQMAEQVVRVATALRRDHKAVTTLFTQVP